MLNPNDAALRDVRTKLKEEECASGMGLRLNLNDAAVMDAQIVQRGGVCLRHGANVKRCAAVRDAPIK
jgi:hypothetical protein